MMFNYTRATTSKKCNTIRKGRCPFGIVDENVSIYKSQIASQTSTSIDYAKAKPQNIIHIYPLGEFQHDRFHSL